MEITNKANNKANLLFYVGLVMIVGLMFANQAHAGTGGTEFDDIWTTITDWTQGTLVHYCWFNDFGRYRWWYRTSKYHGIRNGHRWWCWSIQQPYGCRSDYDRYIRVS